MNRKLKAFLIILPLWFLINAAIIYAVLWFDQEKAADDSSLIWRSALFAAVNLALPIYIIQLKFKKASESSVR